MRMSEKYCNNNNSDNPLTSHRTDGGKKEVYSALVSFLIPGKKPSYFQERVSVLLVP